MCIRRNLFLYVAIQQASDQIWIVFQTLNYWNFQNFSVLAHILKRQLKLELKFSRDMISIVSGLIREKILEVRNMKIIYVNCGVKNYMKVDHCSYRHNFCSCERKPEKRFRLVWDSNPWPLWYRCSALPTELTSQLGLVIKNPWKDDEEVMNIWKS